MDALILLAALGLDWLLGEPRRFHPLVGFGHLSGRLESICRDTAHTPAQLRLSGLFAAALLLLPITGISLLIVLQSFWGEAFSLLALYLALGHRSLYDHVRPIAVALAAGDEKAARELAGRIVSRDTETLDIACATTESVLENGNDAVFATLFWFVVAGAPGAILYRLANTLDAMWGYRNQRYQHFGWAAARLDDVLNYPPARLTALTYALLGKTRQALLCWKQQAPAWDSPNAGPVMASGAAALGIQLGGAARYQGEWHQRPALGLAEKPQANDIVRALRLVSQGVWLWVAIYILLTGIRYA